MSRFPAWSIAIGLAVAAAGCSTALERFQPWERGDLAGDLMRQDAVTPDSKDWAHITFSKEASPAGSGSGGGGCGLQLKYPIALLLALGLLLRSAATWAQSSVKLKRLRYDETKPGILVDEDSLEALLQLENEDQLHLGVTHDVVTGASPTGLPQSDTTTGASTTAGKAGQGQQFAKFADERWAADLGYAPLLNRTFRLDTTLHLSTELDYRSTGLTEAATFELNKKNTTLTPAVTVYRDRVLPSNGKPNADKNSAVYTLDMTQILGKRDVITAGLAFYTSRGYLTDPYKKVLVGTEAMDESRPDHRAGSAVKAGWRTKLFEHSAADLKLRYYSDDWGVRSTTANLSLLSELGDHWLIEVFGRYYQQSHAYFWASTFPAGNTDKYRTADPRLSTFDATTLGLTGTFKLNEHWWFEISYAQYLQLTATGGGEGEDRSGAGTGGKESDANGYLIGGGEEGNGSKAYLKATVFSAALQYRW